jgi:tetratricopeptide (TPR) repeat protein
MKFFRHTANIVKRDSKLVPRLIIVFCSIVVLTALSIFAYYIIHTKVYNGTTVFTLAEKWKRFDYQSVYDTSTIVIQKDPFNNSARIFRGYAAFYLAVSDTDMIQAQGYLDESINCIRVALQNAKRGTLPQLNYMLGKAYFYKDTYSSYYYYADLSIHYLTRAKALGYKADDIPEYLGLSYASLGMTLESISAFTEALLVRESDLLLLSIAEQYYKAGQKAAAVQYLFRIATDCKDENIITRSHLLLGTIYCDQDKLPDAQHEFETILQKNTNSADAHYGLGVIYEKQGDLVKARSEWRKAISIQSNHAGALKKMADYNK